MARTVNKRNLLQKGVDIVRTTNRNLEHKLGSVGAGLAMGAVMGGESGGGGDYYESARGLKITQERALKELRDHGIHSAEEHAQFFKDMGKRATYHAHKVLNWLGY